MFHIKKSNKVIEDKAWTHMRDMLDREMPEKKKKRRTIFFWLFSAAAVTALCWYAFTSHSGEEAAPSFARELPLVASSDHLTKSGSSDLKPIGPMANTPVISKKTNRRTDTPKHDLQPGAEVDLDEYKISSNVMASISAKEKNLYPKENIMKNPEKEAINSLDQTAIKGDALLVLSVEENSAPSREKSISFSDLAVLSPSLSFEQELIRCPLSLTKVSGPLKTNKVRVYGGLGFSVETNPSNKGWMAGSDVALPLNSKLDIAMGLWYQRKITTATSQAFFGAANAVLPLGSQSVVNVSQWTLPLSLRYKTGCDIFPYTGLSYHRLTQITWQEFSASKNEVEQSTTTNETKDYFTSLVRQNVNKNQFTWDAGLWWNVSGKLTLKLNYSHRLDKGEVGLPSGKNAFGLSGLYAIK